MQYVYKPARHLFHIYICDCEGFSIIKYESIVCYALSHIPRFSIFSENIGTGQGRIRTAKIVFNSAYAYY
jgi:hypothetical protein